LHFADQAALLLPDGSKGPRQFVGVPGEFGPIRQLVDVNRHNLRTFCGDYGGIRRKCKIILRISCGEYDQLSPQREQ
jgi:hypothetical protein